MRDMHTKIFFILRTFRFSKSLYCKYVYDIAKIDKILENIFSYSRNVLIQGFSE
jgi:hypothetical protein